MLINEENRKESMSVLLEDFHACKMQMFRVFFIC